jgi:peptide/nickel transport system substrate-binding protein/glutathione transport system substrate-binding protein
MLLCWYVHINKILPGGRFMKKTVFLKSLFFCVVLVLPFMSACTKKTPNTEAKVVLTIGSNADILTSLDRFANFGFGGDDNGYMWGDPLVATDHLGTYTPALALEWSVSADYLAHTFKLRQGIKFHDGLPFTAKDVKKTYERLHEDTTLVDVNSWGNFDYVEVIDDYTAIIHLSGVMPTFYDECARVPIISEAAFTANPSSYFLAPAGTGAYKITSFERTTGEVRYARNDDWWGWTSQNKSNVDEIIYKNILEDTTRASALLSGDVDIATQLTMGYLRTLDATKYNITQQTMDTHMHIEFQCKDGSMFSDKNLREAFSLAIDRQLIVDSVLEGGGIVATWPVPEGNRGYVPGHEYAYNPDRAKQLIAASRYNGERIVMILTTAAFARATEVAQAIQSMAQEVGFNITIESLEFATFTDRRTAGVFDITLGSFAATCGDPQVEASVIIPFDIFGSNYANDNISTPGGRMKALGLSLQTMGDLENRTAALKQFFTIEMEEFAPFAYLYSPVMLYCSTKSVNNLIVFADASADFRFIQKR